MEKLRRFSFDGMADELKDPSHPEHAQRDRPETGHKDGHQEEGKGQRDERDTDGMAEPV